MFLFKGTALVRVLLKAEEAGKDTTTHTQGNLLHEIYSCNYGSLEVSQFATCKLETQESEWYNSSLNLKA